MLFVVGGGHELGKALVEEGCRLELHRVLDASQGELALALSWGEVSGDHVVQDALHACVGEVGSDALPHDAGAQHRDLLDLVGHLPSGSE